MVVGEIVAGRYELEELVGSGGMSSVFKARDTLLERRVALKVLHPHFTDDDQYVERFRREARAVASLSHPNIVTILDRGEDEGRQFIVFELVEGRTLKEVLDEEGRLPVARALEIAIQVARGLAFAHEHGLVHRDVKPQNVILNGDGRAKVTDFGIARSLDVQGVTQSGAVLGTSNYIAPEQASGQPVDRTTDVYSLGVVLFELLTGEVPFPGESFVAVAMQHVSEPPPSLLDVRPDVPVRVAHAVDRALEKDPPARFLTMDAFAAELQACLAELGSRSDPDADVTLVRRPPVVRAGRRRLLPSGLVVLGLVLLALAVAALLLHRLSGDGAKRSSHHSAPSRPVRLTGVGSWDPYGDHAEHNEDVSKATDGNLGTYWTTEHYDSFTKPGVGLVLAAPEAEPVTRVTVRSDTPGFTARIEAGSSESGSFSAVSPPKVVGSMTKFRVSGPAERYYVVWITKLEGVAHVNEVKASG
ncbi:MAG: serine/threonine protein kinase [Actinobacteria bacterium]|nr:MAG: serine/threonine protein kinase [Actinomycetota bacterium]